MRERYPHAGPLRTVCGVHRIFHVTSSRNRDSIEAHGLDWRQMGAVAGIAGSRRPEVEGVFVCTDRGTADWFLELNNTGGPVDVWELTDVGDEELLDDPGGYRYLTRRVERAHLILRDRDVPARPHPGLAPGPPDAAYASTLTITLDDGSVTVLHGDEDPAGFSEVLAGLQERAQGTIDARPDGSDAPGRRHEPRTDADRG